MALIEIEEPTPSALRWFGLPFLAFFALFDLVLWTRGVTLELLGGIGGAALAVCALYYLVPALRRPIYMGWMYAAYPFGFVIAHVVMAAIYFLVITPIGLLTRLAGRRTISRSFDSSADSYWQRREPRRGFGAYFKQY